MSTSDDLRAPVVALALGRLLRDKTTGAGIVWAGGADRVVAGLDPRAELPASLFELTRLLQGNAEKTASARSERRRAFAEVTTPRAVCARMCADFATEFSKLDWRKLADVRCLEIACGEAPFVAMRYDAATGEPIPLEERTGILDQKLRAIGRGASYRAEWSLWALRALESVYGFELLGDSLLIARMNALLALDEHCHARWGSGLTRTETIRAAGIIAWNFWQMDFATDAPPFVDPDPGLFGAAAGRISANGDQAGWCRIYNWRARAPLQFKNLKNETRCKMDSQAKETAANRKFDFVIGNPPYQDEAVGDQKNFAAPVYNLFMEEAYKVSDKVELITPARFLFNAGSTPKVWNKKMLNDSHLKVLHYEPLSEKVFPGTDIKGGVAITYRDTTMNFGAIELFIPYMELSSIWKKVVKDRKFTSLVDIVYSRTEYRLSEKLYEENPWAEDRPSKGHRYDMSTNVMEIFSELFTIDKPQTSDDLALIYGLEKNNRIQKWVKQKYLNVPSNFKYYKVFVPKSNGSGALGEVLSTPVVGRPVVGHTETFISIGCYKNKFEAEACLKYIKSKFARTMLGILKITQDNPPKTWTFVPLQDFTKKSDIDWTKSVPEIDKQLYKKYGLSKAEIEFIETKVKEMD